jgi:hypothetical protein
LGGFALQISRSQIRRLGGFALQITRSADHRSPDGVALLFRSPDQPITDHPMGWFCFSDHQISRSQITRLGGFAFQITRSADHRSPDAVVLLFRSPDQPITDHPIGLPRNYASSSSSKQQVWVELLEEGEPQRGGTKSPGQSLLCCLL